MSEFHLPAHYEYEPEQLVPASNVDRWSTIYGEHARQWLSTLPSLVSEYAEKWDLSIERPLEGGSVSVVIAATRDGEEVVLKIHPPWLQHPTDSVSTAKSEVAAFKIWDGIRAPRLLAHDTQALLLEHITPAEHSPDMSPKEVADLVTQIAHPVDAQNPIFRDIPAMYCELWKRYSRAEANRHEAISHPLLLSAISLTHYITGSRVMRSWELIHGDFKPKNILKRPDGSYVVIDPSPALGSRLYDVALWAIDKPEDMLDRCAETADYLQVDPQIIGSLAVALAIPEICLASPARAQRTLEHIRAIAGTDDLDKYFQEDFAKDDFMGGSYIVAELPNT